MWTSSQRQRLAFERALLASKMPQFSFCDPFGDTYISGVATTNSGRWYLLKLDLPSAYPYEEPDLYITSPNKLSRYGGVGTINDVGTSHDFHVYNNHGGCVKICHFEEWDASRTCLLVLLKGHLWLEAYHAHLRTGRVLAEFLC